MLDNITGFTIEPTNICTLKCPKCSRTQFIEQFPRHWKNKQLNLEHLKAFLDIDLTDLCFTICGDYGDAIYYDDLINLVSWLKQSKAVVSIHTNGSYKSKDWWEELASHMDTQDRVVFALDGLPNNFTKYRINADWESIQTGINTIKGKVKLVWQFIPFSFNEHQIDEVKQYSQDLGFDEFLIVNSSRWDSLDDPLRPKEANETEIIWKSQQDRAIAPKCKMNNYEHFITSSGYYTPCCWVANHNFYHKSEFYENKNQYDISNTTISNILKSKQTLDFFQHIETKKPSVCTYNCPQL